MPASDGSHDHPYSLVRRLSWRLLPPLILLLVINAGWSWNEGRAAANRAYDRVLTAALKGIADNVHSTGGVISVDIPYSTLDISDAEIQGRVYYAVIGPDGALVTGYDGLEFPYPVSSFDKPRMADANFLQMSIRLGALSKRLYDPDLAGSDQVTVLFAETTEARNRLALDLFVESIRPQALLIAVGTLMILLTLSKTFQPLLVLRDAIRRRDAEDLTPVEQTGVPSELMPLIDAINFHMARLERLLQVRRRFLADAAHQIRTPLTVLGTQAEYGQRLDDPAEMRRTFAGLLECIRSTRRMANQMLTLARAETANEMIRDPARVDLCEVVRDVAGGLASVALRKRVDLAFDAPESSVHVGGDATLLHEMVSNLIDNALRYTPANGHVTIGVEAGNREVSLSVADDGPGIPESEREKVFQRFYRILGQGDAEGSGLGLSIVREICRAHRGEIRLETGPNGRGLKASAIFPVCGIRA
jgi:two-component system sensor histidine kinase TctE